MNLEELDQMIDRAMRGAAERSRKARSSKPRCMRWRKDCCGLRNTEKTSVGAGDRKHRSPQMTPHASGTGRAGHGRNGAQCLYRRAKRSRRASARCTPGDRCPECARRKSVRQKEPGTLVRIVGQAPLAATVFEMERLRCNACGEVFTAAGTGRRGAGEVRRDRGGDDRAAEVRQRSAL